MNDFAFKQDTPGYRPSVNSSWVTGDELGVFRRHPVARFEVEDLAPWSAYGHHVGLAQPGGGLDQRVEHGFEIERRAADDLEHIGGGGLLLEGLAEFVEQPGVLDRDDGLIREGLDHRELLGGEGSNL